MLSLSWSLMGKNSVSRVRSWPSDLEVPGSFWVVVPAFFHVLIDPVCSQLYQYALSIQMPLGTSKVILACLCFRFLIKATKYRRQGFWPTLHTVLIPPGLEKATASPSLAHTATYLALPFISLRQEESVIQRRGACACSAASLQALITLDEAQFLHRRAQPGGQGTVASSQRSGPWH